jgi:hypothetical protein
LSKLTVLIATYTLLAAGLLTTLVFMAVAGDPARVSWWGFALPFAAWTASPYAAVAVLARHCAHRRWAALVVLVAAGLLSGAGALILANAFIFNLDPQSGIVLVLLPVWQLIGLLPFALAALALCPAEPRRR